jgi:hypothetical protein
MPYPAETLPFERALGLDFEAAMAEAGFFHSKLSLFSGRRYSIMIFSTRHLRSLPSASSDFPQ